MRLILILPILLSAALAAGSVHAAERTAPQARVSVDSAEGKAIVLKVRQLTRQLARLNRPMVLPNPVHYGVGDRDRATVSGDAFLPGAVSTSSWPTSSRNRTVQDRIDVGGPLAERIRAERAELLARLDLDDVEKVRILYR